MTEIDEDLRTALKKDLLPLFGEVHRLALNSWSLRRKLEETNWAKDGLSEESRLAETTSLEALRREVVLGLCRLDEDSSDKWSFHAAKTMAAQAGFPRKFVDGLNALVKEFRREVNPYKNEHRNAYIAHVTKRKFRNQFALPITEFDSVLKQCVFRAFEIIDYILSEPMEYGWYRTDASAEPINLRREFEK